MRMKNIIRNLFNVAAVYILAIFLLSCDDNQKIEIEQTYNRANSYEQLSENPFEKAAILFVDSTISKLGITGGSMFPPVHSGGATYLLGSEGHIAKFQQAKPVWVYSPDEGLNEIPLSNLVIDAAENAYYVDTNLAISKISPQGKLAFRKNLDIDIGTKGMQLGELALSRFSDGLLLTMDTGYIAILDTNGKIINSKKLDMQLAEGHSTESGLIAVGLTKNNFAGGDRLAVYDSKLSSVLDIDMGDIRIVRNPVINDGIIYIAGTTDIDDNRFGVIRAYSETGEQLWEKQLMNMPRSISVAQDSTVYVPSYSFGIGTSLNSLTALDKTGETIWNKSYKMDILSNIFITGSNLITYAKDFESAGIYRFSRETGQMKDFVSISDKGSFHYRPSIGPMGEIYLSRLDSLSYGYVY